jgi:hypothetical protein
MKENSLDNPGFEPWKSAFATPHPEFSPSSCSGFPGIGLQLDCFCTWCDIFLISISWAIRDQPPRSSWWEDRVWHGGNCFGHLLVSAIIGWANVRLGRNSDK